MWINVKNAPYSAVGDGSADDTAAIQAALDDAAFGSTSERNAVYFPPGLYRITDTLLLTKGMGVRLIGVGRVQGSTAYLPPGYRGRDTGAVLFWDGDPGESLLKIHGTNFGTVESSAPKSRGA